MIITSPELEAYQSCPARWNLLDQYPLTRSLPSDYIKALKATIHNMYAWLMSNNRHMSMKSVQGFWDRQWWEEGMKDETKKDKQDVFKKAAQGWVVLEKFYANIYKDSIYLPAGVNFDFTYGNSNVDYKIHLDLILSDKNGSITYIELGGKCNEWQLFTSLVTKLEVCGLTHALQKSPVKKIHIDLASSKTNYLEKTLHITPEYVKDAVNTVNYVTKGMENKVIYSSWSESCKNCPCAGKCWY